MAAQRFASVREYIASFPEDVRPKLRQVRAAILRGAPDARESISYHMPTYTLPEWVLYFSGYKSHVSLHGSVEDARPALREEMAAYEASGRGTLKLPLDEPMPVNFIEAVARESWKATRSAPAAKPRAAKPRAKDWSSMQEMSKRLLEERTGATLRTWNARVKKLAPKDEATLRAWLGKEGVTGYAQSLLVMERFGYPDFLTADADELIGAQYEKRAELRPVFDRIVDAATALGDVTVQARKTYVSLVGPQRTFARVQAAKAHVALGLRLDGAKPRGRLKRSRIHQTMPVQVELARADEVDDEVLALLQRAYDGS